MRYFFQGKFWVGRTFYPTSNYFPNPWQRLKICRSKKKKGEDHVTHTKSQPVFYLSKISCHIAPGLTATSLSSGDKKKKRKPCGLPRFSYFSKDLRTDMQIKQWDGENFFLFSFFLKHFYLVPRPKLQINQICRFSGVVLHDPSLISEILSLQAACAPSSAKSVSHWVAILFSHWVCLCCSGHI